MTNLLLTNTLAYFNILALMMKKHYKTFIPGAYIIKLVAHFTYSKTKYARVLVTSKFL